MSATIEEWRECPGFPDYQVSSLGNLRRVRGRNRPTLNIPLAQRDRGRGYLSYVFKVGSKRTTKEMHPLICEAFHGPRPTPHHEAAHWDGARANNRSENLRWATRGDNMKDMVRHGRSTRGERSGTAKLTEAQVREIRRDYAALKTKRYCSPSPVKTLADRFGVSPATIKRTVTGERWSHIHD